MWTLNKKIVYKEQGRSVAQLKLARNLSKSTLISQGEASRSSVNLPKIDRGDVSKSVTRLPHTVYL